MTLTDDIKVAAQEQSLPWQLVYAICKVESSLNPYARRYEPRYKWLYGDANLMTDTELIGQRQSWGLMQVMGAVARELGLPANRDFTELCKIPTGLLYGCLHLRHYRSRYTHWTDAIAAYNAGSPRRTQDGRYTNHSYVEKVLREWNQLDPTIDLGSALKPLSSENSK